MARRSREDLWGMVYEKPKPKPKPKKPRKKISKASRRRMGKAKRKSILAESKARVNDGSHQVQVKVKYKPPKRVYSQVDYDFLKYIRIVFKWAKENYPDLKRPDLEMLLYLYPIGAFSRSQYVLYHKPMGLYAVSNLNKMIKGGWIKKFREGKGRQHVLYKLTEKANRLCGEMHKLTCGDKKMSEHPNNNAIAKLAKDPNKPKANKYYMDIIKKMNKDKNTNEV
jgi:DNA-binding HxlR family transcriptional regulator